MSQEIFKAPRTKRHRPKSDVEPGVSPPKRVRTKDDFYKFCSWVLAYTRYEQWKQEDLRAEHNTSPLDSAGSTTDSYSSESTLSTSSKDESLGHLDLQDSDDESWELITCFCMKPYAGRPMIECSQCNVWIHLSCAKIRKSNIPDTFVCQACKDNHIRSRKSSRVRTENKRVTVWSSNHHQYFQYTS